MRMRAVDVLAEPIGPMMAQTLWARSPRKACATGPAPPAGCWRRGSPRSPTRTRTRERRDEFRAAGSSTGRGEERAGERGCPCRRAGPARPRAGAARARRGGVTARGRPGPRRSSSSASSPAASGSGQLLPRRPAARRRRSPRSPPPLPPSAGSPDLRYCRESPHGVSIVRNPYAPPDRRGTVHGPAMQSTGSAGVPLLFRGCTQEEGADCRSRRAFKMRWAHGTRQPGPAD